MLDEPFAAGAQQQRPVGRLLEQVLLRISQATQHLREQPRADAGERAGAAQDAEDRLRLRAPPLRDHGKDLLDQRGQV